MMMVAVRRIGKPKPGVPLVSFFWMVMERVVVFVSVSSSMTIKVILVGPSWV